MKKIFKGLGLGLIALLLVVGMGAGTASATLTLTDLTMVSSGALTLNGAAGSILTLGSPTQTGVTTISGSTLAGTNSLFAASTTSAITIGAGLTTGNLTLGKVTQAAGITTIYGGTAAANTIFNNVIDGSIAMGNALTTGTMTFGNATQTGATVIYGGSLTNAVQVNAVIGAVNSEAHGLDVVSNGLMSSGDNLVGVNSVLTPTGTAGTWASAVYGKVVQGATKVVSGYISGGEFEVADTNAAPSEVHTLVLDSNSTTFDANSSYIWAQDFGTSGKMPLLFKISGTTVGTTSTATMVSTTSASAVDPTHSLKIQINGTAYYIPLSTSQTF